jgi:hypothetical protein
MWITTSLSHLSSTISRRSSNRRSMTSQSTKKLWAYDTRDWSIWESKTCDDLSKCWTKWIQLNSSRTKIRANHASWLNRKSSRTTISWFSTSILWIWCEAISFNLSYSMTKLNTSWFLYATLLSDQWFMCFVSNETRSMLSNIFSNIMNIKTIEYVIFARIERKSISMTNLTIIALNTTLNENQSCQKHRSKMKSSNVWNKFSCQWSTSCSKTSIWTTNDESS